MNKYFIYRFIIYSPFALLFVLPFIKFYNLRTHFFDFGQYINIFNLISRTGIFDFVSVTHTQLFLLPYSFLLFLPNYEYIIILIQSSLIFVSIFIMFRFLTLLENNNFYIYLYIYLFSLSVWFAVLSDFHFEHLLFPFIFLFYFVLFKKKRAHELYLILLALGVCAVKEPYALTGAALGIVAFCYHRRLTGLMIFFLSCAYFLISTQFLIPLNTNERQIGSLWFSAFGYLGISLFEIISSLILNPVSIFFNLWTWKKIVFIAALYGPFIYVAWLSPITLLPTLPSLLITLLSVSENHAYLGHHYTIAITASLIAGSVVAISQVRDQRIRKSLLIYSLATSLVSLILFGPSPISRLFWSDHAWSYNWRAYLPDARAQVIKDLINSHIPADAQTAVSVQNSINLARIADRPLVFAFPAGVFEPEPIMASVANRVFDTALSTGPHFQFADYVVLDTKRPLTLGDRTCLWDSVKICTDQNFILRYSELISRINQYYNLVIEYDGFTIYSRKQK